MSSFFGSACNGCLILILIGTLTSSQPVAGQGRALLTEVNVVDGIKSDVAPVASLRTTTPVVGSIVGWGQHHVGPVQGLTQVSGGFSHSLGLKLDGSIVAWGYNASHQCDVPLPNSNFTAVAAGGSHSLGLKLDGSIAAWGDNTYLQCNVPALPGGVVFIAVAAGRYHSIGLRSDHSIAVWGAGGTGQSGEPHYGQSIEPPGNSDFTAIACGWYHNLGLRTNGSIEAWGRGNDGQCTVLLPNSDYTAIAAGAAHSLGLKSGSILGWGFNGDGETTVPTSVPNSNFTAVAAGGYHSLGRKSDGSIAAWGRNVEGQTNVPPPNSGFAGIAGGAYHSVAFRSDGTVAAWGKNDFGQSNVPEPNASLVAVAGSGQHTLGLRQDGSIAAWGDNTYGQCNVPNPNSGFTAVAAGRVHSLALRSDGSIAVWGAGSVGQAGDPHYQQSIAPVPNTGFIAIAAGWYHSMGLKGDGSIAAWGAGGAGQSGGPHNGQSVVPLPNSGFDVSGRTAIAAGGYHSLGRKSNNTIAAWGDNTYGQCTVPGNSGYIAIAAGGWHSLGLKVTNRIFAWGLNGDGQTSVNVPPQTTGEYVAIAAGDNHSLGLKLDGSIKAWGLNNYGQINPPVPGLYYVAIAGGGYNSLGLKAGDCNGDGVPDICNINCGGLSDGRCSAFPCNPLQDCNNDGVPDECQVPPSCPTCPDCDANGVPDNCQLAGPVSSRWAPPTPPYTWNRAGNWCQPVIPNNGTPAGNTYTVTIPAGSPICTLDINPNMSSLTIQAGGTLEVNAASNSAVRTLAVESFSQTPLCSQMTPTASTIENAGTIRARDGKRLLLDAANIVQCPTGRLEAVGQLGQPSKIQINGQRVRGGTAYTSGIAAVIELLGGAVLDGVTIEGNVVSTAATVSVPTGQTGIVENTITNQGIIEVAAPTATIATFLSPADVGASFTGTGCVLMRNKFARLGEFKGFVTNGTGHCVEGAGRIFGAFTNETGAIVTASHPTHILTISAPGPKTSAGLIQAVGNGTLSIEDNIAGAGQFRADGGTLRLPGTTPVTVAGASLDVLNGGQAIIDGAATINISSHVHVTCPLLRGCTPPTLNITGNAHVTVGGNVTFDGGVTVASTATLNLAGNFDNQAMDPTMFHWESGPLSMNGSVAQSFELAGRDLGPGNPAGFINNFAMGTLRIEPGRTVDFFDVFDNSPGSGCEALYVDTLSLGAGSTIRLHGCSIYYRNLVQESGSSVLAVNGGMVLNTHAGDLDDDGDVDLDDLNQFTAVLLGNLCSVTCLIRSDVDGNGFINGADIGLMVRLVVGW